MSYFYCYDIHLFNYLTSKGFSFITKARHYKTNVLFSMYLKTPELSIAIDEWEATNH
ncbi:hypothetical protein ACIFOE_25390 [Paenibacillus sp. NRS-1783]|uniref:hypothetical protein n=1 Tax=Paenibacillus sp. NRS-1783 TaxID=3233907 RepID=UPI003D27108D